VAEAATLSKQFRIFDGSQSGNPMKHSPDPFVKSRKWLTLFFLLMVIGLPAFLFSQSSGDTLFSTRGDTVVIRSIPIPEINTHMEEVNSRMAGFPKVIHKRNEITEIDSLLLEAYKTAEEEEARIANTESELSLRSLQDLKRQWEGYQSSLLKWQNFLSKRVTELVDNAFEARGIKLTWQKTKTEAVAQQAPPESIERIQEIVDKAAAIEQALKKRQDTVLLYQNEVTDLQIRVNQALDLLSQKRIALQSQYFLKDSPALWNAGDSTVNASQLKVQLNKSASENLRQIHEFRKDNQSSNVFYAILFLFFLLLFYVLNRVVEFSEEDSQIKAIKKTRIILRFWPASAFILTLMLSFLIYANIPIAIREFIQFLLLIPTLILLPRMISKKLNPLLFALVILFIIGELQYFLTAKSLFSRMVLLSEGIFSIWLLIRFTRKEGPLFQELNPSIWMTLVLIKPLIIILLVASVLANIFGYVNLAMIVTSIVINSILIAIMLAVIVNVLDALFIGLFRTDLFNKLNMIRNSRDKLLAYLHVGFVYLALFALTRSILIALSINEPVTNWLIGLFSYTWEVGSVAISIGGLLAFFLVILITALVTKLIRIILEEEVFPRVRLSRGVPGAISMVVRYTLVAFGGYIALTAAGIDLGKFGLIAGALGVGIGFGLQGIVSNFIAGLILAFERPIQKGDTVEIGTLFGDVMDIGVRASTIRTYDGSEVIVPNGNLISNEVINWTLSDRKRRRVIPVSVAYGSKPREVMEILFKVADDHPEVLDFPKPWPLFDGFGDSALNFRVLFWVDFDRGLTVTSEVAVNIYDALEEAGIKIPYTQQDLHIKSFDPTVQEVILPWTKKGGKGKPPA
jgi:small-conductance mechanosensitive channel